MISSEVCREVHELARVLGIDRRDLMSGPSTEAQYDGAPCELCTEYGADGGLRYVELSPPHRAPKPVGSRLFEIEDNDSVAESKLQW